MQQMHHQYISFRRTVTETEAVGDLMETLKLEA
jgi:hypothetical protein